MKNKYKLAAILCLIFIIPFVSSVTGDTFWGSGDTHAAGSSALMYTNTTDYDYDISWNFMLTQSSGCGATPESGEIVLRNGSNANIWEVGNDGDFNVDAEVVICHNNFSSPASKYNVTWEGGECPLTDVVWNITWDSAAEEFSFVRNGTEVTTCSFPKANLLSLYGTESFNNAFKAKDSTLEDGWGIISLAPGVGDGFNSTTYFDSVVISNTENIYYVTINMIEGSISENQPAVSFTYNGTLYNTTQTNISTVQANFTTTLTVPTVDVNKTIGLNWTITFVNETTNITNSTTTIEYQQVWPFTFDNCSAATTETLNFTLYDEANLTTITGDSYSTWDYIYDSLTTKNFSVQQNSDHLFCLDPSTINLSVDMIMEYEATDYGQRTYYFNDYTIDSNVQQISLYLLESPTVFVASIRDSGYNPLSNALLKVLRFYPDENAYKTVEIARTDYDGNAIVHLDGSGDVTYRYIIENSDGDVVLQSGDSKAYCATTSCELSFYVGGAGTNPFSNWQNITGLSYSLTYNNDTKIITYTWSDSTGATQYGRLVVDKIDMSTTTNVCDVNSSSTAGTLTCNVSAYDVADLSASAYISQSPEQLVDKLIISIIEYYETFGNEGVFWIIMLILAAFFVGAWLNSMIAALMLSVLALFFGHVMGMIGIGLTSVTAMAVLAVIIIMKMRNR